jgi:predicted molibdopterin-dependent oxidoreductase YjgC
MLKGGMDDKTRLFGEITKLVKISIEGEWYEVPDQLEILRCFQYLGFEISFEHFCWNASCENCASQVACSNKVSERMLLCQLPAEEGMVIEKLPEGVKKIKKVGK